MDRLDRTLGSGVSGLLRRCLGILDDGQDLGTRSRDHDAAGVPRDGLRVALVGAVVEEDVGNDLSVLFRHDIRHPAASHASAGNDILHPGLQGLVFDILHAAVVKLFRLAGLEGDRHSLIQHRDPYDGYRDCPVIEGSPDRDGGIRGVDELHVRSRVSVVTDRRVLSRRYIGRLEGVGVTLRGRNACPDHGIIQGRGDLADAAARLLDDHSVLVGAGRLIAAGLRAVSRSQVKGKFLSHLQDLSVHRRAGKLQIVVSVRVCRRLRCIGTDDLVLFLCLRSGKLRLDDLRGDGDCPVIIRFLHCRADIRRQLFLVDAAAVLRI